MTEVIILRHAPAETGGRLAGRRDVPARLPSAARLAALRSAAGPVGRLISSPALRCRQTIEGLYPGLSYDTDPRLWEQDFGVWEDCDPARLPDLGPLSGAALAAHRPPGGESFADLCDRVAPLMTELAAPQERQGPVFISAHAGIVRAVLALATGRAGSGLIFEVAPLSLSRFRLLGDGQISVGAVNHLPR